MSAEHRHLLEGLGMLVVVIACAVGAYLALRGEE